MEVQMLVLTTPEGMRIAIDASQIESVVEQKKQETGRYNDKGIWVTDAPVGCDINMKSGDSGKVRETFDKIVELMQHLGEVE